MASGDTKTQQYLDIAAHGTREDIKRGCCDTRTQSLILDIADRIIDVEEEVEEIKTNPDVADIVATYEDLENYDTSTLEDRDIIRVLSDSTHDGNSTYYRYDSATDTFTYIGAASDGQNFIGTDGVNPGVHGLVPAPATTDVDKFLNADGTWKDIPEFDISKYLPTDTASGDVANFMDGADNLPVVSLIANIKPNQNLNGYDYPWPGGGNKNLLKFPNTPYSYQRCTYTVSDNDISVTANNQYARASFAIPVVEGETYTVSLVGSGTGDNNAIYLRGLNPWSATSEEGNYGTPTVSNNTNIKITFTAVSNTLYFGLYVTTTGTTGTMTLRNVQLEKGSLATPFVPYANICPITGWTGMTINRSDANTTDPTTYNVSWQTEAGTIYGGTLNVTTGELTSNYALVGMDELQWSYAQPTTSNPYGSFYANAIPTGAVKVSGVGNIISDMYKTTSTWEDKSCRGNTVNYTVYVIDSSFNDDVQAFAGAVTGHYFCYEIEPTTYQLTPLQINTLLGENNIWQNTGDVSVSYKADIQGYVDKQFIDMQYEPQLYIETDGTSYIETELYPSNTIGYIIDFESLSNFVSQDTYGCIMGSRVSSSVQDFQLTTFGYNGTGSVRFGANQYEGGLVPGRESVSLVNLVYTDASGNTTAITGGQTFSSAPLITLGALHQGVTYVQGGLGCRFYDVRFFDGDTLVAHFKPVKRVSDNAYGLYDWVGKKFYAGVGTITGSTTPALRSLAKNSLNITEEKTLDTLEEPEEPEEPEKEIKEPVKEKLDEEVVVSKKEKSTEDPEDEPGEE